MGNLIAGTTIQGRTFNDIAIQKSKEGVPRPIVFGVARPIVGNVIATTEPKIITVREEAGGKGGGTEVENEEVYRTYAIRICEGPATVRRVWRNNKLVYDARADYVNPADYDGKFEAIVTQVLNNQYWHRKATFYRGDFSQMPSPVLEEVYGIGNVPAHRGTCYMVIDNENLTDNGGAIPQYAFEVVRGEGFVLTSKPYEAEATELVSLGVGLGSMRQRPVSESASIGAFVDSISLESVVSYSDYDNDFEVLDVSSVVSVINLETVVGYSDYEVESESLGFDAAVDSIFLETVLAYWDYDMDPESSEFNVSILSINLVSV